MLNFFSKKNKIRLFITIIMIATTAAATTTAMTIIIPYLMAIFR